MIRCEQLVKDALMTPSVARLLFGSGEDALECIQSNLMPKMAYRICVLYSALIQSYLVGRASAKMCTIKDLELPEEVIRPVSRSWDVDDIFRMDENSTVFSMLIECEKNGRYELVEAGSSAVIIEIRDVYKKYSGNTRMVRPITDDLFRRFLQALPLLRNTTLDTEDMKIVIGDCATSCAPFLTFWDVDSNMPCERETEQCYVFSSADRGEKDNELFFNIVELNGFGAVPRTRKIRCQISPNESLRLVCNAVGIKTTWYPVDECWCDLTFLKQIMDITEDVLLAHWGYSTRKDRDVDVIEKIRDLFENTPLYHTIDEKIKRDKCRVLVSQIDSFLYELFITQGVFKSMFGLLKDSMAAPNSKKFFSLYMDAFIKQGIVTLTQRGDYEKLCDEKIRVHKDQLKRIFAKGTSPYNARAREIEAEWRAYYVLKAAGIQSDNLFADRETLLSIDNYFQMIKNPTTRLEDDLRTVLCLLIELYGSLLRTEGGFRETDFHRSVWSIRDELKGMSVEKLFERFIQLVELSKDNEQVDKLIGRKAICDSALLREYKDSILKNKDEYHGTALPAPHKRYVFISYAHCDEEIVKACVKRWIAQHYEVFLDENRFSGGDAWKVSAKEAIESEFCVGVCCFLSKETASSEPVDYELRVARKVAANRFKDDRTRKNRFVIPISLTGEQHLWDVIGDAEVEDPQRYQYAKKNMGFSLESIYYQPDSVDLDHDLAERMTANDMVVPVRSGSYSDFEHQVANFYAFLKFGDDYGGSSKEQIDAVFYSKDSKISHCIFPLVASVKETKIKRDNITMSGYELINGKEREDDVIRHILSSKRLYADDYYCIPHYRRTADDCTWMVEPLMISHRVFTDPNLEE